MYRIWHIRLFYKHFRFLLNIFVSYSIFVFICHNLITDSYSKTSSFASFNHFKLLHVSFSHFFLLHIISPTQHQLMGLLHKRENCLTIFFWVVLGYCSWQVHTSFSYQNFPLPFPVTHAPVSVCVLKFLTLWSVRRMYSNCILVIHRKCAENALITRVHRSASHKQQIIGESVTLLPELWSCYLSLMQIMTR